MFKIPISCLLIITFLLTPLTTLSNDNRYAINNELSELSSLLPESEIMIALDSEQILKGAIPNLLNHDAEKLKKLETLVKTVEQYTGFDISEIKSAAIGFNVSSLPDKTLSQNRNITAIIRTNNSNINFLDNWAKKYDSIFNFEKERAETKSYIESFKRFKKADYSKFRIEERQSYLLKLQANLKQAKEIENRLKTLPKSPETDSINQDNTKLIDNLNTLIEIFQPDISLGNLTENASKLIRRSDDISIDDSQRSLKLNQLLKDSQAIYPEYAKKFNYASKSGSVISIVEIFDEEDTSFTKTLFFDKTNVNLSKIVSSFKSLPSPQAARKKALNSIRREIKITGDEVQGVFDTGTFKDAEDVPIDKPEAMDFQKTKIKDFYQEFKKSAKEETINAKKLITIDWKLLREAYGESPEMTEEKAGETDKNKKEITKIEKLGFGFLDDKTVVIGTGEQIGELLKRDNSYKNPRAAELMNFSANSLIAFAVDSKQVEKNSPKPKAEKSKTPNKDTGAKTDKKDGVKVEKDKETDAEESDKPPVLSPSFEFTDYFRKADVYGSLDLDSRSGQYNDISLSLGILWNKEEPEEPLLSNKNEFSDSTGDQLEIAGVNVGKALFDDLLKSFKGLQASLIFKFEKEKVANLLLSIPDLIDGKAEDKNHSNKTQAQISPAESVKLHNLQDLLTEPIFYADLIKTFKSK